MKLKYYESRNACPVCSSNNYEILHEESYASDGISHYLKEFYIPQGYIDFNYLEGMTYTLIQCKNCRLIFQKEVPNDELLHVLYDQWIDPAKALERNKSHDLSYRVMRLEEVLGIIMYFNKPPQNLEVLDFGMGWGSLCVQFKALGVNAKGVELSIPRKLFAESQGVEVVSWEDLDKLRFDFINTDDVFEHLTDPVSVLKKLSNALKPGGIIKISTPNAKVSERAIKKMDWYAPRGTNDNLNAVSPLEHLNCFYTKSIITLGEVCKLKPIQVKPVAINQTSRVQKFKKLYRNYILGIRSTDIYLSKQQ